MSAPYRYFNRRAATSYVAPAEVDINAMSAEDRAAHIMQLREALAEKSIQNAAGYSWANIAFWVELFLSVLAIIVLILFVMKRFGVFFTAPATADEETAWNFGIALAFFAALAMIIATLLSYWTRSSLVYKQPKAGSDGYCLV